jgi:hypothetical protein
MDKNGCFTTLVPGNNAFRPKTRVFHNSTCRRLAKCSKALPNIILGPMDKNGCFTTLVLVNSAFRHETQDLHLFTCRRFAKYIETLKHYFGSNKEGWRLHNFGTPKIVHLGPSTQVSHRLTCQRLAKCNETLPNIIFGPIE